ncbi:hypothetical protein HanIR_Chr01g0010561 [Helianthus annuus]|nr:hypothetical protein HanIR_Chr01g0010561 [Helianthus annuus]
MRNLIHPLDVFAYILAGPSLGLPVGCEWLEELGQEHTHKRRSVRPRTRCAAQRFVRPNFITHTYSQIHSHNT